MIWKKESDSVNKHRSQAYYQTLHVAFNSKVVFRVVPFDPFCMSDSCTPATQVLRCPDIVARSAFPCWVAWSKLVQLDDSGVHPGKAMRFSIPSSMHPQQMTPGGRCSALASPKLSIAEYQTLGWLFGSLFVVTLVKIWCITHNLYNHKGPIQDDWLLSLINYGS